MVGVDIMQEQDSRPLRLRIGAFVIVLLALTMSLAAQENGADERNAFRRNTGIGIWTESLSQTADIGGGTYLTAGVGAFLGNAALIDVRYMTDIMPGTFSDQLVLASIGFKAIDFGRAAASTVALEDQFGIELSSGPSPGPAFVIAPTYLVQLAGGAVSHYAGLTISPVHSWKVVTEGPGLGVTVDILTVRLLLDVVDYEFLWGFTAFSVSIF